MEAIEKFGISWPALMAQIAIIVLTLLAIRHAWKQEAGYGFLFWLIVILVVPVVGPIAAFLFLPTTKRWSAERFGKNKQANKTE